MNVVDHGRVIVGICIGQAVDSLPLLTRHGKLRSQATRISQVMILTKATEISRCIRQGCAHPVRIPMFCHAQWHLHRSRPRLPHRDSPHGRGSSVSRRKLCGCRVARCVHIRKPCEQEEARRASSAAADRNRTQRQLSTERTQHQLDCQTRNELNVNSAAARAKRTQCQLGSQTRNGSSTNSTGNPPSSFPGDPVTHPPQLVFLARRWSRRSVRQHSVKGQPLIPSLASFPNDSC